MRTVAAIWRGAGEVTLESADLPAPGPGEVVVRVRLATVCGSDLHTVAGRRAAPCPSVLGHEAVGDVVGVGAGAGVRVGQRVVWGVTVACGSCDRCRAGRTAKCREVRKVGHERFDSGWSLSGAYAEHVVLPAGATVVAVPAELDDAVAAPAACATATVMAAVEAVGPLAGARVLVSGAGMLGVTAVAAAVRGGASRVVVVDVDEGRAAAARSFGATDVVLPGHPLPEVDVAIEVSGSSTAVGAALGALDIGGRLVLAGSVSPAAVVPVDPERVVRRWLTVTGVHNYEARHLGEAVDLLATTAHLPWGDLVTPPVGLSEVGRLLRESGRRALRTSVAP